MLDMISSAVLWVICSVGSVTSSVDDVPTTTNSPVGIRLLSSSLVGLLFSVVLLSSLCVRPHYYHFLLLRCMDIVSVFCLCLATFPSLLYCKTVFLCCCFLKCACYMNAICSTCWYALGGIIVCSSTSVVLPIIFSSKLLFWVVWGGSPSMWVYCFIQRIWCMHKAVTCISWSNLCVLWRFRELLLSTLGRGVSLCIYVLSFRLNIHGEVALLLLFSNTSAGYVGEQERCRLH